MHGVFTRLWADTAGGIQRGSDPECLPERILGFTGGWLSVWQETYGAGGKWAVLLEKRRKRA